MTPGRWKKLDALSREARELRGGARAAHLAEACGDDEQLRAEAERLLAAHERGGVTATSIQPYRAAVSYYELCRTHSIKSESST